MEDKKTKKQLEEEIVILRQYVVNLKNDKDLLNERLYKTEQSLIKVISDYSLIHEELQVKIVQDKANKYSDDSKNY
jgi:hypothetical protein